MKCSLRRKETNDTIPVYYSLLAAIAAQVQSSIKKPTFKITVAHKTGMGLVIEEEIRRRKIKSLQRKNKRRKK